MSSTKIKKPSKYGNVGIWVDGIYYASQGELQRWNQLKLMERGGLIQDLKRQVRMPLEVNGYLIGHYIPDFTYTEKGEKIYEDFKGMTTDVFRLKQKLMKAIYGIDIKITKAVNR